MRDEKIRKIFRKTEIKKNVLKSLLSSYEYNFNYRLYFTKKFSIFSKSTSISFYKNSCMIRKAGHVVFRDLKLGRNCAKFYASEGYLVGFRRASF